ncbi:MAG TPA: hypothetical protein ENO23_04350 [Alphaproteobacteria bacterium]|nr:hypothetical protein [Alphaproteobacteria bacterium]
MHIADFESTTSDRRRHRHRSRRRKLAESIALILGVPLLLLTVLGLSVELIEYRPTGAPPSASAPTSRRATPPPSRGVPVPAPSVVPDVPPFDPETDLRPR